MRIRPTPASKENGDGALKEALDVLIDQNQRLFAIYDTRRSGAETKIAGILTATVAVTAVTATAAGLVKHVSVAYAIAPIALLALSIVAAIAAGSAAGLRGPLEEHRRSTEKRPFLSTESERYRRVVRKLDKDACEVLRKCKHTRSEAIAVRARTLELWQARQLDAHRLARGKDRGVAVAGFMFSCALVCGAVVVGAILTR